jgi:ribosomal protein L37AE/L43A
MKEENRQEDEKMVRTNQTLEIKLKKIINCKFCDEKFISRFKLKRHIKLTHKDDIQNITPGIFTCRTCHKVFTSYIERFYHEKDDHDQIPTADDFRLMDDFMCIDIMLQTK